MPPSINRSSKKKDLLVNIGLAVCSIIVSFLIAEIVFYHFSPQPTYAVRYSPWGFEHIPNISFKHTPESKEAISYIEYNSEGFRGPDEYQLAAPENTLRVAILGDSYSEGAEVDYQFLHGTVLEELLNEHLKSSAGPFEEVEVIKAGVYAYDSCQELRLFKHRVQKYEPAIVLLIYTGELEENQEFCKFDGENLQYIDLEYSQRQYYLRYAIGYIKAKSHVLNYLHRTFVHLLGGHIHHPEKLNHIFTYEPPKDYDQTEAIYNLDKPVSEYISNIETIRESPNSEEHRLLFAIFNELNHSVNQYGGELVVIFSHDSPESYALGHYLKENSIPFFDMNNYVIDHRTEAAHFPIDGHWNEYGHRIVAQGFYEMIADSLP